MTRGASASAGYCCGRCPADWGTSEDARFGISVRSTSLPAHAFHHLLEHHECCVPFDRRPVPRCADPTRALLLSAHRAKSPGPCTAWTSS